MKTKHSQLGRIHKYDGHVSMLSQNAESLFSLFLCVTFPPLIFPCCVKIPLECYHVATNLTLLRSWSQFSQHAKCPHQSLTMQSTSSIQPTTSAIFYPLSMRYATFHLSPHATVIHWLTMQNKRQLLRPCNGSMDSHQYMIACKYSYHLL
jgi:hypothetical protein